MATSYDTIRRGEIWIVDFEPSRGDEIQKLRPALVISSDGVGILKLKLVVPITEWKASFANSFWHVKIEPTNYNGQTKIGALDALQVRSVSYDRFQSKRGEASATVIEQVAAAVAGIVEYQ